MIIRLQVAIDLDNEALRRLSETLGKGQPAPIAPVEIADSFARQIKLIVAQFQGVKEVNALYLPPMLQAETLL